MVIEKENLEKSSPLPSSPRERRKCLPKIFLYVCVHSQMASCPLFFFSASGRSSLDRNGSGMFVPSHFLLIFSLNPFAKSTCHGLKMGVPHCRLARLH